MKRQRGETTKADLLDNFACCGNCIFFQEFDGDVNDFPKLKNTGHCYVNPPTPLYDASLEGRSKVEMDVTTYVSVWPKTSVASLCRHWIEDIEDLEKTEFGNITKKDFRKFIRS